jgi:hypothetical protein
MAPARGRAEAIGVFPFQSARQGNGYPSSAPHIGGNIWQGLPNSRQSGEDGNGATRFCGRPLFVLRHTPLMSRGTSSSLITFSMTTRTSLGLHSRKHDDEVMFYAFDILVSDGEDLRKLPLHLRKNNLARLLVRRVNGIFLADFEQGEIGPDLFRQACLMGLEGLVSKHKDRPYRAGRSPHWVKVKNREHPAMERVMDSFS